MLSFAYYFKDPGQIISTINTFISKREIIFVIMLDFVATNLKKGLCLFSHEAFNYCKRQLNK